ncbi:Uronate isomerase [Anaerohalosphaera lusitana]|uniref:Uronate isomerase n=1 Tax=Anaerohalosphaera lusitana TaxID=1936003 RepID=A0A1U9NL07_9BACT|nr:glucuronate isomerase [Anaerohalosphaera lusitana]AQT68623.1 Uronate isomerase [Anaerohalosphaera lusitana]
MSDKFLTEEFLLFSEPARQLYHEFAAKMPIYDYHCHLPAAAIAEDINFDNLAQAWLGGDHYKWRAMRTNGAEERYCTGDASDREKFQKWAETVPYCIRNPLYHWTHMELKKPFGIEGQLLGPDTADAIYEQCSEMLRSPGFSVRGILKKMNVELVCTTEDPLDSLEHHQAIKESGCEVAVHTAWRPDKAMGVDDLQQLNAWIDRLGQLTDTDITGYDDYLRALDVRHQHFHDNGCRLSDHGLEVPLAAEYTNSQVKLIFDKIRTKQSLNDCEKEQFQTALLVELTEMNFNRGWVQQLHIGPIRNNSSRLFKQCGPDAGFDSMGDAPIAKPLAALLDRLDTDGKLAKTIIYNINPKDNETVATMIGNFQDGSVPGKMQYGSGWWFLDQIDGMTDQMRALSNMGLLSRFIGMTTDSRSFLSFPRHEYFRRVLCNLIGDDIDKGLLPADMEWMGKIVEDICFNNANDYFGMELNG